MTTVDTVPSVYAKIENRPGMLQQVGRLLGERGVNIEALGAETHGTLGFVRILTPRFKEAIETLRSAGFDAHESQLVVVSIPNRPGGLGKAISELTAASINVEGVVTTTDGRLAFRTSDNERAVQLLRKSS